MLSERLVEVGRSVEVGMVSMHVRTEHAGRGPLVWPRSRIRLYGLPMAPTAGILLTGGGSRRLGTDKASLVLDGETLAQRAGGRLAAVCAPVVEIGDGRSGLPSLRETPPGAGPLTALAAAGGWLRERGHVGPALLLAVDLPAVDGALLAWLRDRPGAPTAVPRVDGRLQLVCAALRPRCPARRRQPRRRRDPVSPRAPRRRRPRRDRSGRVGGGRRARRLPRHRHPGRRRAVRSRPSGVSVKW